MVNAFIEWFETIGHRFYRAFIEKDRYLAYLDGIQNNIDNFTICGSFRCGRGLDHSDY